MVRFLSSAHDSKHAWSLQIKFNDGRLSHVVIAPLPHDGLDNSVFVSDGKQHRLFKEGFKLIEASKNFFVEIFFVLFSDLF
jgi:hypothetical protein